jgi:hypothetical protein
MGTSRNPINSMAAIKKGSPGDSAYLIAAKNGFRGTEAEWLSSLHGEPGINASVTKESVESVLTGEITSHSHPGGSGTGNSYFPTGW